MKGLTRRQRQLLLGSGIAAVALYASYKLYTSETVASLRTLRRRMALALESYSQAAVLSSELSISVMHDLQAFLASESDELPQSLRQLSKVARSGVRSCGSRHTVTAAEVTVKTGLPRRPRSG